MHMHLFVYREYQRYANCSKINGRGEYFLIVLFPLKAA
jgi:hypothetical protein